MARLKDQIKDLLTIDYERRVKELIIFTDVWDVGFILLGLAIISAMFITPVVTAQRVLVIVTMGYSFLVFNQMKQERFTNEYPGTLSVRPHFGLDDDRNDFRFGMKNFGNGPAINLRGCVIAREENGEDALDIWRDNKSEFIWTFSSRDHHLSLLEGELLPLTTTAENFPENQIDLINDIWNSDGEIKEIYDGKQLEFHYTFESNRGIEYPQDWYQPSKMDMETVISKSSDPRIVEFEEMDNRCKSKRTLEIGQ
ncbi:hypothetical protein [Natrinema amylolyticum]|uniref:hypothetical protein n=1 Tax=Natrinema amylolyticum TaxID=2878679 RepID=UPI001CFBCB00|nr:hypothetical protein [Natrinema amylolyticum]